MHIPPNDIYTNCQLLSLTNILKNPTFSLPRMKLYISCQLNFSCCSFTRLESNLPLPLLLGLIFFLMFWRAFSKRMFYTTTQVHMSKDHKCHKYCYNICIHSNFVIVIFSCSSKILEDYLFFMVIIWMETLKSLVDVCMHLIRRVIRRLP